MPVIVVTRLRLRDPAVFDEFSAGAVAVVEQAKGSAGNLGADVLAEAHNTYWTRTAWQEQGSMSAFVGTEPHLSTMNRIAGWCDEATFVSWEQDSDELPDWTVGYERILADGKPSGLTNPTAAHHTREFPSPVIST